jgi:RNA polymerase sigma-70 factor, ECF subfamily
MVVAIAQRRTSNRARLARPALAVLQNDVALVAAVLSGDQRAVSALVHGLHPAMLRVAQGYVSSWAVAEEVVQDAWLGVFSELRRFEGRSSLRAWVFGILANCARARGVRDARSVPLSSLSANELGPGVVLDRCRRADQQLSDHQIALQARRAIDHLPSRQRVVILLRDVEGLGAQQVCELLGLSEANQRVLLHRAREKVREALESAVTGRG